MNSKKHRNPSGLGKLFRRRKNLSSAVTSVGNAEHVIKINVVSKEVAKRLNEWMDAPYKEGVTEQQDIELFALRITNFIHARLKE